MVDSSEYRLRYHHGRLRNAHVSVETEYEVADDRARLLFTSTYPAVAAYAAGVGLVLAAHMEEFQLGYWIWAGAMALALAVRAFVNLRVAKTGPSTISLQRWFRIYCVAAVACGLVWGMTAFVFVVSDSPDLRAVTVMILVGVTGGALTSIGMVLPVYGVFLVFGMVPTALVFTAEASALGVIIGVAIVICVLFWCHLHRARAGLLQTGFDCAMRTSRSSRNVAELNRRT